MKIEIFKIGKHTDSEGHVREWTKEDLENIATAYNEQDAHEAPVVLGHPKDNAPAYGWVDKLTTDGKKLFAELKDLAPEFVEWVKKGLYKKRSISLYPDFTLKHIGFLGATPPAIKGLEDVQFASDKQASLYEFRDWRWDTLANIMRSLREFLIEQEGAEAADKIISNWQVEDLKINPPEPAEVPAPVNSFKEEDQDMDRVKELETKLAEKEQQFAESAEAQKAKDTEIQQLKTQLAEEQAKNRQAEFAAFCETNKAKITPALRPVVMDFMHILDGAAEYEFAEGDAKAKKQPLEAFKSFCLAVLPDAVQFGEEATKNNAPDQGAAPAPARLDGQVDPDRQELHEKALAYMEKNPGTDYAVAIDKVRK